jgi:competence protein ComEC
MSSLQAGDPLTLVADNAFACVAGQSWEWDGVRFEVLHPPLASYDATGRKNDRGCVVRIAAPGGTVLIPADIERRSEELLREQGVALRADVVIAPHHGSKTSSTLAFVEAVRPRAVVFPVGYRNRFSHPHPDVVRRYLEIGTTLFRSDTDGAVTVKVAPEGPITIERYRAQYRRYWLDAPAGVTTTLEADLDRM